MECHKCKYNGMKAEACLSCQLTEKYNYSYQQYIFDGYDVPQHQTNYTDEMIPLNLSEEDEDKLRIALCNIFSLNPLELLMLQAIMNGKSLTDFSKLIERLSVKNSKCTRFHAFQVRKSLIKKIPQFKNALITNGQRKPLKDADILTPLQPKTENEGRKSN